MKNYVDQGGCNPGWRSRWITSSKIFIVLNKFPFLKTFFKTLAYFFGMVLGYKLRWPKSVTAISICSRQFQFAHGNFSLLTAISICSRQFQFAHGNFNLFTAISICSRQFQFTHGNFNFTYGYFNLLTAISQFYSRHFQFFHGNAHGIFRFAHHLSATATASGLALKSKHKIKSR